MCVHLFVFCLSVNRITRYAKLQAVSMKLYGIMDYCYEKNQLNISIDPSQNGQMAAILGVPLQYTAYYSFL